MGSDNFEGEGRPIVKYRDYRPCAAAMRPFVKLVCCNIDVDYTHRWHVENDAVGCEETRLRGASCGLAADGRQLSSCRQDSTTSAVPVASELSPDPRLVARPAALRQPPPDVAPLVPSAGGYCSAGSFYYAGAGGPLVDLAASCQQQRSSTFCRAAGLASGSDDDDDDDGHVASSEEEESKPRIWSLADVATSCRAGIRGSASGCMTGTGGHAQNGGGGSFLPWSGAGYYAPSGGSTTLYPSYYQSAAAAAAVVQQRPAGFRPSEMVADSSAVSRHHPHQLLAPPDQSYLRQQHQMSLASPRNSSFSPGTCTQQPAVVAAASTQFNDVIGFCAAGLRTSSLSHLGISPRMAFQGYASGRPRANQK